MPNINYIASAGTGKTYNLISEVIKKILDEDVSLKNLLILTFTEKTATELKEKLLERIKEILNNPEISKEAKVKLHKQLIFVESGYIGTFHSVFLRLLKKYPENSRIDNSFSIISNDLDSFLDLAFEKWVELDFETNKKDWQEIINILGGSPRRIKEVFTNLYKNRLKLTKPKIELNKQQKTINRLKRELEKTLDKLFTEYRDTLNKIKEKNNNLFKLSPFELKNTLKENNLINLPNIECKSILKKSKNIETLENDENFKNLSYEICKKTEELRKEVLDYNANIILKKFFQFLEFVEKLKEEEKAIDFNDILEKTFKLINNEEIREKIKSSFKYILIDEFQDTDTLQNKIIEQISNNNIYVFGDPKQCIYTWRDADLEGYYAFLEKNNFQDKVLEKNFRSSKTLVEFYNNLLSSDIFLNHIDKKFKNHLKSIEENKNSYIKLVNLKTNSQNKEGQIKEEALYTVELIKNLKEEGHNFGDIMILFRKNDHLKTFKEILIKYNIPVSSTSNDNLFEKEEIKTVINILKLIEFPKRQLSLLKILKSPLVMISDLRLYENKDNLSVEYIKNKNLKTIQKLIENKNNLTIEEIIDQIYQETDLLETYAIFQDGNKKIENLKKLKTLAKKKSLEGMSLRDFILYTETSFEPESENNSKEAVQLLTMHKSKGLESKVVIIPLLSKEPWQEELNSIHIQNGIPLLYFPKSKVVSKNIKIYEETLKKKIKEEQERLFYVAITRAKEKLIFISSGKERKSSYKKLLDETLKNINLDIPTECIDLENIKILPLEAENENKSIENTEQKLAQIKLEEEQRKKTYEKAINTKRFKSVSEIMKETHKEEETIIHYSKKQEENISIYTGILVHSVLENIDFKSFSIKEVKKLLEEKKLIVPENIRQKVFENSFEILERFENSKLYKELQSAKILFKELPFTLYEENTYIDGRIDLIYEKDGKVVVMDYKTNRYETEEEKAKILSAYQKQKEYYSKAIKRLYPDKNVEFKLGLLWKGEVYPE